MVKGRREDARKTFRQRSVCYKPAIVTDELTVLIGSRPAMDLTESKVHSFIVKLWLEGETSPHVWHGHITHVPSGTRRYFKQLSDITDFVAEYIDGQTDAQPDLKSRMKGWLRKRRD